MTLLARLIFLHGFAVHMYFIQTATSIAIPGINKNSFINKLNLETECFFGVRRNFQTKVGSKVASERRGAKYLHHRTTFLLLRFRLIERRDASLF